MLFHRFARAGIDSKDTGPDEMRATVESVIHEVTLLLNSRSTLSATAGQVASRRTVLDYGLPDFVHFSPLARQDARALAGVIRQAVEWHEPRLRVQDVTVETPRPSRDVVFAAISGQVLRGEEPLCPVQFQVRVAAVMSQRH